MMCVGGARIVLTEFSARAVNVSAYSTVDAMLEDILEGRALVGGFGSDEHVEFMRRTKERVERGLAKAEEQNKPSSEPPPVMNDDWEL